MEKLDPRTHAYRPDIADENLRGRVEAVQFVKGQQAYIKVPVASIHKAPEHNSMQTSQALYGEACTVFETTNAYAWVQMQRDSYVGYVAKNALAFGTYFATHHVCVPSTFAYPQASIKSSPSFSLPLTASVIVNKIEGEFAVLASGEFIYAKHISHPSSIGGRWHAATDEGLATATEFAFVTQAEKFLHVPYLWGGKTFAGLDCSGLVQIALQACGQEAPRDSDMQEEELGLHVSDQNNLQRGDLVFWPGHVGIMQDANTLLHANGFHMQVTSEPLTEVTSRSTNPISFIKRLATIKP